MNFENPTVPTNSSTTKGSVLIVEDSPDVLDIMVLTLSKAGLAVFYAESRDKAMEYLLGNNEPDVILMDVGMSGLTLGEFVSRTRTLHPDIPIVLVSAAKDLPRVAQEHSIHDYIKKPFYPEVLESLVVKCVTRRKHL